MASIMMLRCYRKEVSEGFHLKIKKIDKFIKDINLGGGSSSINYVLIKLWGYQLWHNFPWVQILYLLTMIPAVTATKVFI